MAGEAHFLGSVLLSFPHRDPLFLHSQMLHSLFPPHWRAFVFVRDTPRCRSSRLVSVSLVVAVARLCFRRFRRRLFGSPLAVFSVQFFDHIFCVIYRLVSGPQGGPFGSAATAAGHPQTPRVSPASKAGFCKYIYYAHQLGVYSIRFLLLRLPS